MTPMHIRRLSHWLLPISIAFVTILASMLSNTSFALLGKSGEGIDTLVTERWGENSTAVHTNTSMDAPINVVWPNDNDGKSTTLSLQTRPGHQKGILFFFDVSNLPTDTFVEQATLRVWIEVQEWADVYASAFMVTDPDGLGLWREDQVTFNARSEGVPWSLDYPGTITASLGAELDRAYLGHIRPEVFINRRLMATWVEWDVTEAVRQWVANPATNHGVYIAPIERGHYIVYAREHSNAQKRPYLQVTYRGQNPLRPPQPTELRVFHRSGQTFITWREINSGSSGEAYRIYRHTEPITAANLDQATLLAEVPKGSSYYKRESEECLHHWGVRGACSPIGQTRYIIEDYGSPLDPDQGLFVYTVHEDGVFFYAVTSVVEGNENRQDFSAANATREGIAEHEATPRPVIVWESPNGLGRIVTQFMDYHRWNPNFEGYAYNYYIGVPPDYDPETTAPLPLVLGPLHGWGGTYSGKAFHSTGGTDWDWPVIQVKPDDRNRTWWFGFGEYVGHPRPLRDGRIVNYTEQRLLQLIQWLQEDSYYKVDMNRVYVFGESMGGSGSLSLSINHPDLISAAYAGEAMTDYRTGNWGVWGLTLIWGTREENIPTTNGVGIYDWMHIQRRIADWNTEMPYFVDQRGQKDTVIPWTTQGLPFYAAVEAGRKGYLGLFNDTGHDWDGIYDTPNFTFRNFNFPKNESFPAFGNASISSDPSQGPGCRNCYLEWSSSVHNFAGPPVDEPNHYEIVLRVQAAVPVTADVTPRRLQRFRPTPAAMYRWRNVQLDTQEVIQSGITRAYGKGLITVEDFIISPQGNRLIIEPIPPTSTPPPSPSPTRTPTPTPTYTWTPPPSPSPTRTPTPTPTYTWTPPPSPSPTRTPTPSPTPSGLPNRIFLPLAVSD